MLKLDSNISMTSFGKPMFLKFKILLLSILPVALALGAVTYFVNQQSQRFVENQVAALEAQVVSEKQQELKNYIELALTSIEPLIAGNEQSEAAEDLASQQVKRVLQNMTFSEDGYFFVYDMEGTNILHPKQPWRVGVNWWNVKDANGHFLIQDLIAAAQAGGGYVPYLWERPTTGMISRKISYAVAIDRFDWMLGTGVYLDEIDHLVAALRNEVENQAREIFVAIWLIFAACMLGIGFFITALAYRETSFANTNLRRLYNKLVDVQEEERSRVSRDLHDGISQILVSAKYELALASSRLQRSPDAGLHKLTAGIARIDDALLEVRRISADLRPKDLDDLGLAAALRSLGQRFQEATSVQTDVSAISVNDVITTDQKSALYRIAQEALTNIQRHAVATKVEIHLDRGNQDVTMNIYDDGVGLQHPSLIPHGDLRGMGLRNMEERLAAFNGKLTVGARRDGTSGTRLEAIMPFAKRSKRPITLLATEEPS